MVRRDRAEPRAGAPDRPGGGLVCRRRAGRRAVARRLRQPAGRPCASAASPTRPARRRASATPGLPATAPTGRSWCGSATPTARRARASSAASPRCPSCSRRSAACRLRTTSRQPPPADVLRVASWRDLPVRMRTLGPDRRDRAARASPTRRPTPASSSRPARPCRCTAMGGKGSLRWLDRRPPARQHQVGARRRRAWCRARRGRRGRPLQRRDGAHRRTALSVSQEGQRPPSRPAARRRRR